MGDKDITFTQGKFKKKGCTKNVCGVYATWENGSIVQQSNILDQRLIQ